MKNNLTILIAATSLIGIALTYYTTNINNKPTDSNKKTISSTPKEKNTSPLNGSKTIKNIQTENKPSKENSSEQFSDNELMHDESHGKDNLLGDSSPEQKQKTNSESAGELIDTLASTQSPDNVDLWTLDHYEEVNLDSIPAIQTTIPVDSIKNFKVGQELSFELPGAIGQLTSTLVNATNPIAGVTVWEGDMDVSGSEGNVIVSQGEIETLFTFTTPTGVYTASVDNATGKTVIVDQAEYHERALPIDDVAELDPSDLILIN